MLQCISGFIQVAAMQGTYVISLIPRPSEASGEGEGEGRPGIHCMRMCYIFCIIYHKSVRTNSYHVLTSEMVHVSKEYRMTSCLTFVLVIVLNACPLMDNVARTISKSHSKFKLSKPTISRYSEHNALRLQGAVSIHNRIIQNLNNNSACTCSEYQAFPPPSPLQKAWG